MAVGPEPYADDRGHISGLLDKRAKQCKRNLVNNPDQDLVLPLLGSVVSELELKAQL